MRVFAFSRTLAIRLRARGSRLFGTRARRTLPFGTVAEFLWGPGHDYDSDGNSRSPDDREWTELTVESRELQGQRVDVDPAVDDPLVLMVRSERPALAARVAFFLAMTSEGEVATSLGGPFAPPGTIKDAVGDFDLDGAMRRAQG